MNRHAGSPAGNGESRELSTKNLDAQATLRAIRQPFLLLDRELKVQGANRAFYRTFSVEPDETEGLPIYELGTGSGTFRSCESS